jgi:hypothetical protein
MISKGRLVLDAPMDTVREEYRRIEAEFEHTPTPAELHAQGVERVTENQHSVEVLVSGNADKVVALLQNFDPISIEVTTVGLREIFLEKAAVR